MHTTRAPQLTLDELIDALEAKIAAMQARNGRHYGPVVQVAAQWKTLWAPRKNGHQNLKRTHHPFSNIEEL